MDVQGTFETGDLSVVQTSPPADYAQSLESIAPNVNALIEDTRVSGESWIDSLARLLPVLATTEQQRQLLKIQTQRAAQGLPPLDVSNYAAGVNVGLSSDTRQLLGYALAGAAVLVVLPMLLKRR